MNYYKFKKALCKSWAKDTAYHKDAPSWSSDNPALGQCAISALLFNEYFGGRIYSGISETGIVHYWNKKFGIKIDLTKQQFNKKLTFSNETLWNRDHLLSTGDVEVRYLLLRKRFLEQYESI